MYGNKTMELRENQKADVVFWHSLSPVSISTVRTEGPRPHHKEVERTGSLHERIDSPHERIDSLWVNHSKTRQLNIHSSSKDLR